MNYANAVDNSGVNIGPVKELMSCLTCSCDPRIRCLTPRRSYCPPQVTIVWQRDSQTAGRGHTLKPFQREAHNAKSPRSRYRKPGCLCNLSDSQPKRDCEFCSVQERGAGPF